jgi:hypothetical protein
MWAELGEIWCSIRRTLNHDILRTPVWIMVQGATEKEMERLRSWCAMYVTETWVWVTPFPHPSSTIYPTGTQCVLVDFRPPPRCVSEAIPLVCLYVHLRVLDAPLPVPSDYPGPYPARDPIHTLPDNPWTVVCTFPDELWVTPWIYTWAYDIEPWQPTPQWTWDILVLSDPPRHAAYTHLALTQNGQDLVPGWGSHMKIPTCVTRLRVHTWETSWYPAADTDVVVVLSSDTRYHTDHLYHLCRGFLAGAHWVVTQYSSAGITNHLQPRIDSGHAVGHATPLLLWKPPSRFHRRGCDYVEPVLQYVTQTSAFRMSPMVRECWRASPTGHPQEWIAAARCTQSEMDWRTALIPWCTVHDTHRDMRTRWWLRSDPPEEKEWPMGWDARDWWWIREQPGWQPSATNANTWRVDQPGGMPCVIVADEWLPWFQWVSFCWIITPQKAMWPDSIVTVTYSDAIPLDVWKITYRRLPVECGLSDKV